MNFDHRSDRRLHLRRPASALLSMWPVKIVDASLNGLGVVHSGEVKPGDATYIEFIFGGRRFVLAVTVLHFRPMSGNYLSPRSQPIEATPGYDPSKIRFRSGLAIRERDTLILEEYRRFVMAQLETAEAHKPPPLPDLEAD